MPLLGLVKWRWNIIVPSSLFPLNLEGMRWNWNFVSSFRHKISKIPTMEWRFFPLCSILLHWIHFIPSLCINPKIARRSYFISIIFLILLYIKSYYQYGSLYFSSPFFGYLKHAILFGFQLILHTISMLSMFLSCYLLELVLRSQNSRIRICFIKLWWGKKAFMI